LGAEKPALPFSDRRLLSILTHTVWFLPGVASCFAMRNLLKKRHNIFFSDYAVNVCAGAGAGVGMDALLPVRQSMREPLKSKSITLTCGKLTTGVTVRPWTGIFMLRNLSSPETYFQAAFRVQSPWEIETGVNKREILKRECYIFDFALDRALRQIADYSCRLGINEDNPEKKVAGFIHFLPVIAYDGSAMKQISPSDVLDIAMAGTSAALLARRWESALLVNVDNETLSRLMNNEDAMRALMSIEGFRSLNSDIETIINLSDKIKKAKTTGEKPTAPEKKELTEAEKEYKSKRKLIQEKLIKFATRVPVFMYLTDFREYSLKDVITQLEPGLFKRVTGLDVKDFELLVSLNVFNGGLMNDAVYKFKRYEDASLSYAGVDKHAEEAVGGYDTVLTRDEYDRLFGSQQMSIKEARRAADDIPADENGGDVVDEADMEYDEDETSGIDIVNIMDASPAVRVNLPIKPVVNARMVADKANPAAYKRTKTQKEAGKTGYSGVKAGARVRHKTFGAGTVVRFEGSLVLVSFGREKKSFRFPDAFTQGFLRVE